MSRFVQADADRIAEFLERIAGKAIAGQLVEFHRKAGAQAANGFGAGDDGSGVRTKSTTTSTEGAAIGNMSSRAQVAWAGVLDALRQLHVFEAVMAEVLAEEKNTGHVNTVEKCTLCGEPITGIGNDRVKRLDGAPYHATPCWWAAYNASRGRRGA